MTTLGGVWIQLQGDWSRLRSEAPIEGAAAGRAAAAAFTHEWGRANTSPAVRPTLDPTLFRRQWNMFQSAYLRDQTINVTPVLTGNLRNFRAQDRTLNVSPRLDLTIFRRQWAVFAAAYLNQIHRIHVHPVISPTATQGVIDAFGDAGNRSGRSFALGLSGRMVAILGAVASALPAIAPVLQVLGDIVQAAGAVGAALPAMLATVGVGVGALVLSFKGLGDAIAGAFSGDPTKKQQQAFDSLSKSAKTFVGQLLESRTALKGFRQEVQEAFFRPFIEGFDVLIKSGLFQQLRGELALTASAMGGAGSSIAASIAQSVGSGQVQAILSGSRETLGSILFVLPKAVTLFLNLAEAAQPFVQLITSQLAQSFGSFADRVDAMAKDGRLAKFFEDGATQLLALTRLIINVKDIFGTIFDAFNGGADSALASLSVLAGQFATFLKSAEGQQILALFADKLALIGDIIKTVIGPVLPIVIKLAEIIGAAMSGAIRQLLPVIGRLLEAIGSGLMPILDAVAPVFLRLVTVIADFLVLALRDMAVHIETLMPTLVDLARQLGPQLIPLVEAFGDALLALLPLIPAFTDFLAQILPIVIDLLPFLEFLIAASVNMTKVFAQVIEWVVQVIVWMSNLRDEIALIGPFIEAAGAVFRAVWDGLTSFFTGTVVPMFRQRLAEIREFFSTTVEFVRGRWQAFQDFIRTGYEAVKSTVFDPLANLITNTIPAAFRSGVDLVEFWWRRLRDVAAAPVRFVVETVVNKGIIGTFNKIGDFLPGLPDIPEISVPGLAAGGMFDGLLPGKPSRVDNLLARGPNGKDIALATGEFVVNAEATRRNLPTLLAINSGKDGYALGGIIGMITDPAGFVRDRVDSLINQIPGGGFLKTAGVAMARKMVDGLIQFVKDKISTMFAALGGGGGVGANGLQAGISGLLADLRAVFGNVPLISGLRPGDRTLSGSISYHSSGRAIDIAPVLAWAQYISGKYGPVLRELITPWNNLNIHNGRPHTYTGAVWNQHNFAGGNAHIHAAMAKGGLMARLFDGGGSWPSGTVGVNLSGRTEQVVSGQEMDAVIDVLLRILAAIQSLAPALGRELTGVSAEALRIRRARPSMGGVR